MFPGMKNVEKNRERFPGIPHASPSRILLPKQIHIWVVEYYPHCLSGKTQMRNSGNYPALQGRLTHVQRLFTWNPSPLMSLQSSRLNSCYYHQDLHQKLLEPGSRPTFLTMSVPSYTLGTSLLQAVGHRSLASAPSIFGASPFGR